MKILKRGRTLTTEAKCPQPACGAVLLVEEGDLFSTYNPEIYGYSRHPTYRCPCCGSVNQLPEDAPTLPVRGQTLAPLYNPNAWTPFKE